MKMHAITLVRCEEADVEAWHKHVEAFRAAHPGSMFLMIGESTDIEKTMRELNAWRDKVSSERSH